MIYITGDIHGNPVRLSSDNFPQQKQMSKEDVVIICGDFGLVWKQNDESANEKWWLDWLENKSFTTAFVDGNHENFDRLYQYPVKEWNGGQVHEIRPSVLHLMRGEIYTIDSLKFFAFGGAASHDILDGILDPVADKEKIKQYELEFKMFRVNHLSWWEQELPTEEEMLHGHQNLEKHDWKVDYIITHSPSANTLDIMGGQGLYQQDVLTTYLEDIKSKMTYKKHYFGHMHVNWTLDDSNICTYEMIREVK